MSKFPKFTVVGENNKKSEEQLVPLCRDYIIDFGIRVPKFDDMRVGAKQVLIHNKDVKITLRRESSKTFCFLYKKFLPDGTNGTPFVSAPFTVDYE